MSAPSHSLTFSPSVHQSLNPSVKRNSLGSNQLPLPSGLNSPISQRTPGMAAGPSSPRPLTSAKPSETYHPQTSPTAPSFPHLNSPPPIHSSTHAPGIQPSAAFFRPSRPNYQAHYSRPSSPESMEVPPVDHFQLAPIIHSSDPDDHQIAESIAGGNESEQEHFNTLKRIKQSREPLLPGPHGIPPSRPSMNASPSIPTSRLVRNSLDRVMNISRGISFDSIRKASSRTPEGRLMFDTKLVDEEAGYSPTTFKSHGMSLDPHSQRDSVLQSVPSPSPDPSFVPIPPRRRPPLAAVPVIDTKAGRVVKKYQIHPSRNHFFMGGRFLTGGDTPWAFICTLLLIFTIAGIWFGTTVVYWWRHKTPAVGAVGIYLFLLIITTMLATATADPGILPRNLDPDPPYPATSPSDGGVRAPMPRDLKVRTDIVRVKYCPTCKTYRPPRSSHCKMCDNCVDGCDHHCQWVNNCVGRRNYTTFFALLVSAVLTLILIIITSALHLFFLTRDDHMDFRHALGHGAGSAVVFLMSIAVIWPVAALLSYHMRLLLLNITTIEQIRNQAHKTLVPGPAPPNPFSHGNWRRNALAVICRPQGPSWLQPMAVVTEDKREVNPGMLGEDGAHLGLGGALDRSATGHGESTAEWE